MFKKYIQGRIRLIPPYKMGRRPCKSHGNPLNARGMEPVTVTTLGGRQDNDDEIVLIEDYVYH